MDEDAVVDPNQNQDQNKKIDPTNPEIQAMIKSAVAEAVKDIKTKLDVAYTKRDEALQKVSEFEQKERDLEIKRLQDAGKDREAFELQLAEMKANQETLQKRNLELSRDVDARQALSAFAFRSEKAAKMAFDEVTSQLVQNEKGEWWEFDASNFEARVVLHEMDHLDGLLFLDRVASLKTDVFRRKRYAMPEDKNPQSQERNSQAEEKHTQPQEKDSQPILGSRD